MSTEPNVVESPDERYERANGWSRKGRFWSAWACLAVGALFGNAVSLLAADRVFPAPVTAAIFIVALSALACAGFCFSRARKIRSGEVAS